MNNVTLTGRLAKNAFIADGKKTKTAIITIAVERDYVNKDGKRPVDYIEVKSFTPMAKPTGLFEHLTKGTLITLDGAIRTNRYEKNGEMVYTQEVVVQPNDIRLLARPAGQKSEPVESEVPVSEAPVMDISDEDLPF